MPLPVFPYRRVRILGRGRVRIEVHGTSIPTFNSKILSNFMVNYKVMV